MTRPITLNEAMTRYTNRYTLEHTPEWARKTADNGRWYAPQYASDAEWFERTLFPGEQGIPNRCKHCKSYGQTWPLGEWLDAPRTAA